MRDLSAFVRSMCPEDVMTLDLSHREVCEALIGERSTCGEHGRVIATRQSTCPKCGGYVDPPPDTAELQRRRVIRRLRRELPEWSESSLIDRSIRNKKAAACAHSGRADEGSCEGSREIAIEQ